MQDARAPEFDGVRLLLPSSWWTVNLRDADGRQRMIANLVEQQVGRDDDRAMLRADARRHLGKAADDAAAAGGRFMAISLMRIDDVPVPASLTAYRLPLPTADAGGAIDAVVEALSEDVPGAVVERGEGPWGSLVRRIVTRRPPDELGGDALPMLVVDYWFDPGDASGLLDLTFSSPLVQLAEPLVELFDAIVASVASVHDPAQEQL